jgi:hypothetical protein
MSAPSSTRRTSPYMGVNRFEAHDVELYFGREQARLQLGACVNAARITLLHSASGAGKSSLLRAQLVPALERQGYTPVLVTPEDEPFASLRQSVLETLLPPIDAEIAAWRRAIAAFDRANGAQAAGVGTLLAWIDSLPRGAVEKRTLWSPVPTGPERDGLPDETAVLPAAARLLRGSWSVERYMRHLNAVLRLGGETQGVRLDEDAPAAVLLAILESDRMRDAATRATQRLAVGPSDTIAAFLRHVTSAHAEVGHPLRLALIIDQFEELFTRFSRPAPLPGDPAVDADSAAVAATPPWVVRDTFIAQIAELCEAGDAATRDAATEPAGLPQPLRVVVSFREEYLSKVSDALQLSMSAQVASFRLSVLTRTEAVAALAGPAACFGVTLSVSETEACLADLLQEGRFVDPMQLQIVASAVWDALGAAETGTIDGDAHAPWLDAYASLGRAPAILSRHFEDAMAGLSRDEQLESGDMLDLLITSEQTRNIVAESMLYAGQFADVEARTRVVAWMVRCRLLRREVRSGMSFVELAHDTIVASARRYQLRLRDVDTSYAQRKEARRHLARLLANDCRWPSTRLASLGEVEWLHRSLSGSPVGRFESEAMLRSALLSGARPDVVRHWQDVYEAKVAGGDVPDLAPVFSERRAAGATAWSMNRSEAARCLAAPIEALEACESAEEARALLRGCVRHATADQWPALLHMVREYDNGAR